VDDIRRLGSDPLMDERGRIGHLGADFGRAISEFRKSVTHEEAEEEKDKT